MHTLNSLPFLSLIIFKNVVVVLLPVVHPWHARSHEMICELCLSIVSLS